MPEVPDSWREHGVIFVRLIIGFHLIYGAADNVFWWERMLEFAKFLDSTRFPWPLPGAVISAWAQFLCGILYILGALVKSCRLALPGCRLQVAGCGLRCAFAP